MDFTGSIDSYLHKKFKKHTETSSVNDGVITVFHQNDYDSYSNYLVDTAASGSVEIDNQNRVNILLIGRESVGRLEIDGIYQGNVGACKLVLHTKPEYVHGFPTSSADLHSKICTSCRNAIF